MPHMIYTLIAKTATLETMAAEVEVSIWVNLGVQGMGLLPVTFDLLAAFGDSDEDDDMLHEESQQAGMWRVGLNLEKWIRKHAQPDPIAYIQTDYFGGIGNQGAVVWHQDTTEYFPDGSAIPINKALEKLGVVPDKGMDRFDTLGLSHYRSMSRFEDD